MKKVIYSIIVVTIIISFFMTIDSNYSISSKILTNGNIYYQENNDYKIRFNAEQADIRALEYGNVGYRIHTTEEAINTLKDIYNNQKYGIYALEYSPYDNINWQSVKEYYDNNYGVSSPEINFYRYRQKGNWEPNRWGLNISSASNGELIIDATNIRITKDELELVDNFTNYLIQPIKNKSDYEKIAYAYSYITKTTSYYNDPGYINDLIGSTTSAYDVFIIRKSACIGYSIAFSYLMEKLGIDSYIIDNITTLDNKNQRFQSSHTYNMVKLDGKYYKIDTTGEIFLGPISSNELSNNNLPLSSTSYKNNSLPNIDLNSINNYLEKVKNIKTTTTTVPVFSSTKKTNEKTTNSTNKSTSQNENTKSSSIVTPTTNSTKIIEDNSTTRVILDLTTTKQVNENNPKRKNKINLNYILIPLAVIVILFYIIYKIYLKKKRREGEEQQIL